MLATYSGIAGRTAGADIPFDSKTFVPADHAIHESPDRGISVNVIRGTIICARWRGAITNAF